MTKEPIGFRSRITHPIQCPACSSPDYRSDIAVETLVIKALGVVTIASCAASKCGRIYQFTLPATRGEPQPKKAWKLRRDRAATILAGSVVLTYLISITAYAATK